jgi:hypothetical protein
MENTVMITYHVYSFAVMVFSVVAASQPSYAPPAQASATAYAQTPSGAYAVPVAASPYATAVVAQNATAYAATAEQSLSYGQPAYVSQPSELYKYYTYFYSFFSFCCVFMLLKLLVGLDLLFINGDAQHYSDW